MTLDQKALAAALLPMLAKGIQHNFPSLPYRAAKTAAEDILPSIVAALSTQDVAPAECSCDDPDCPRRHEPLTLRQAYENALVRLREAESVAALPAPEPVAAEQEPLSDNESTMSAMERADRLRKRGYVLLAASERLEQEVHDRAIERLEHIGVDGI